MTKRTDYHQFRRYGLPMLLTCWMLVMVSCASDDVSSGADGQESVEVSLAFNVSTNRDATRMTETVTQQANSYRGIQDFYLFPFNVAGVIGLDKTSLSGNVFAPSRVSGTLHYMDSHALDIRYGTTSFLCYARAKEESHDKFVNGSIVAIIPVGKPNTSSISFAPEPINTGTAVHDKATAIAAYLTAIAKAFKDAGKKDLYFQFINNGHPVACSSTNVTKLAGWAESKGITLPTLTEEETSAISGYPANILLPDGAAVVKWNETIDQFDPQTETTTEVNINNLNRFIYPAELYYYSNSRIKTSTKYQVENYSEQDWTKVLAEYETDDGIIRPSTRSVAIKDPLSYAVGCLQIGLVVNSTLADANGTTITLSDGSSEGEEATFPLTAVFVSGQHGQMFDFTAKDDNELIIYDNQITGMSMGTAVSASPETAMPTIYNNTLVFQTKDGENVRFALEFENNSGQDFMGADGIVFKGTKFYMVGSIEVPIGQTDDWKKRAFTKAYTTQGTVRISSLKQAHTYLPDLLDPRLEIGVKLIPNWILSTPTPVPL